LNELKHLAELLQKKQSQLEEAPNKAQRGDAVVFLSDIFHAGAAPVVVENATAEEGPRVTSYLQFVPTVVVQNPEWWPLLETLYHWRFSHST
jgi:ectoine hydroxylase-related dioxygenase (phytanoyl-CoA dioxygenase family)